MDQPSFRIDLEEHDGWRRVAAHGEIDFATYDQVRHALDGICKDGAKLVELDLRGVTFLDSMGLRALIEALDTCKGHEAELRIRTNPVVDRLLQLTGLLDQLPMFPG